MAKPPTERFELEWLTMERNTERKIIESGALEDCYTVMLSLIQAAIYLPYITPLAINHVDKDGIRQNVAMFSFGLSKMPHVELQLCPKEG